MHIYISKLTIIGADNGLSPSRRQAIILTKDGILLIGPLAGSPPDFHFLFPWFFHDFPLILPEISLMCFVFITENYTTNYTWTMY